jgi:hypothetical protein
MTPYQNLDYGAPRARLGEISPPANPTPEFQFYRWLPKWAKHYGCPDCKRAFEEITFLLRHLDDNHHRWSAFVSGYRGLNALVAAAQTVPMARSVDWHQVWDTLDREHKEQVECRWGCGHMEAVHVFSPIFQPFCELNCRKCIR